MSYILPKYSKEPNFVGYPLFYIKDDCQALCHMCASEENARGVLVKMATNWEDDNLYCDECCEKIESAYNDEPDIETNKQGE